MAKCTCPNKPTHGNGMIGEGACWHIHANDHIKYAKTPNNNKDGLYFSLKGGYSYYEVITKVSSHSTECNSYKACINALNKNINWFAASQQWQLDTKQVSVNVENNLKVLVIDRDIIHNMETLHQEFSNKYKTFYSNDFNTSYKDVQQKIMAKFLAMYEKLYADIYKQQEISLKTKYVNVEIVESLRKKYSELNSIKGLDNNFAIKEIKDTLKYPFDILAQKQEEFKELLENVSKVAPQPVSAKTSILEIFEEYKRIKNSVNYLK